MALIDTTNGKSVTVLNRSGGKNFEDPLYLVVYEQGKQRKRVSQSNLVPIIALRTIISQDNIEETIDPATPFVEAEVAVLENHVGEAVIAHPFQEGEDFPLSDPLLEEFIGDEGDRDNNETIFNSFGPFNTDEELPYYTSLNFGAAAA